MRLSSVLISTALIFPFSAQAADIYAGNSPASYKDVPPFQNEHFWTGFYAGFHAGYGFSESSSRDGGTDFGGPATPPFGAFACAVAVTGNYCDDPYELDAEGWLAGVQLGYNVQHGQFVFGLEGEAGWLNIDEDDLLNRPEGDQDRLSVSYGWYGTLGPRIGISSDRALFYAKGGIAFAKIETEAADLDNGADFPGSITNDDSVYTGWALGGGLEYALNETMSLKAEYLYMDFGSEESRSPDGDIYRHDHELHTVKVGLNFRLSGDDAAPLK